MTVTDVLAAVGLAVTVLGLIGALIAWLTRNLWSGAARAERWDGRIAHFESVVAHLTETVEHKLGEVADEIMRLREKMDVLSETRTKVEVLWQERKAP